MDIDLSPFPTLLLLKPLLAENGRAIRSSLARKQLDECDQIAREMKKITDGIESAHKSGDLTLSLLMRILKHDQLSQLGRNFNERCMEPLRQTAPQSQPKTTQAFWTTTPFQIRGAAHHVGEWIEATDRHLAEGFDAVNTQIIGAAAFLGLAAAAAYRLRFGDTSLLQRLIPAL